MEARTLIDHFSKEILLLKEYMSVLQEETEDLVARDFKRLLDTAGKKEHIILKLEAMGNIRLKLLEEAGTSLGLQTDSSLSSIIGRMGYGASELEERRNTFNTLIDSIREVSKVNSLIVNGSLDNVNKTLGFLSNFMPKSIYKPNGSFEGYSTVGSRLSKGV